MKRFIATLSALGIALIVAAFFLNVDFGLKEKPYIQYPASEELTSFDFVCTSYQERVAQGDNPVILFGTSEQNASHQKGSYTPTEFFATNNFGYGIDLVGRGSFTSIWDAVEMGALSNHLVNRKVIFFPSMQWFMCYRTPGKFLSTTFSEGAYRALMNNPEISDDLKSEISAQLSGYGVSLSDFDNPISSLSSNINNTFTEKATDMQLKGLIQKDTSDGTWKADGVLQPLTDIQKSHAAGSTSSSFDWDSLIKKTMNAAKNSSSNKYGFSDSWYNQGKALNTWLKTAQKWSFDGAAYSDEEYTDFKLFLRVCKECNIEPLVVIQPSKGLAYDQTIYNYDVRQEYYSSLRNICDEMGVEYTDYSDHEYDKYFLADYTHPSQYGEVMYSKAVYDFLTK